MCVCVGDIGNLATLVLMGRALSTVANSWLSFASALPLPTPFSDRALGVAPVSSASRYIDATYVLRSMVRPCQFLVGSTTCLNIWYDRMMKVNSRWWSCFSGRVTPEYEVHTGLISGPGPRTERDVLKWYVPCSISATLNCKRETKGQPMWIIRLSVVLLYIDLLLSSS